MAFSMPGKKYGLVQSKKKKAAPVQSSLFEEGDSSDEDATAEAEVERVNRQIALDRKRKQRKVQEELQQALAQDPQAFAYDEHLEGLEERREKESGRKERARQEERKESKFIGRLMETAQMRERERSKAMEKQIVREIEAEKAVYGDRKAYVTKNYKKHLQEQEEWEAQQAKKDAAMADDVRSKGEDGMGGFYRNLLNTRLAAPAANAAAPAAAPAAAAPAEARAPVAEQRRAERAADTNAVSREAPGPLDAGSGAGRAAAEGGAAPTEAPLGKGGAKQLGEEEEEERIREKKRREAAEAEEQRAIGAKRKREEQQQQREEKIRLARERYLKRSAKRQRKE